jgi:hypothetical protein
MAKLLGILALSLIVSGAITYTAKYASAQRWDGYYRSLVIGEDCAAKAQLADTPMVRLDEAMRCVKLHPGTIRGEVIMRLQHEAIRELAQAK